MTVIIIAQEPPHLLFTHTHTRRKAQPAAHDATAFQQNENYSLCCRNVVHIEHEPKSRMIANIENNDRQILLHTIHPLDRLQNARRKPIRTVDENWLSFPEHIRFDNFRHVRCLISFVADPYLRTCRQSRCACVEIFPSTFEFKPILLFFPALFEHKPHPIHFVGVCFLPFTISF